MMRAFKTAGFIFALLLVLFLAECRKTPETSLQTIFPGTARHRRYSDGAVLHRGGQELLLAVTVFGEDRHDYSSSEILGCVSHDGGRTWESSGAFVLQRNVGGWNVVGPSFVRLSDREVLFFFNRENSLLDAGTWLRRSLDNGATFGPPVRLPYEGFGDVVADHVLRLENGRILVPYYEYRFPNASSANAYAYCFYSDDGGRTWKQSNKVTLTKPAEGREIAFAANEAPRRMVYSAEEPSVVELKDGRLLMFVRTYVKSFYKSYSNDKGATWSELTDSGVQAPGSTPVLARIPSTGDLLLLFNYGDQDEILGKWPRNRLASAVSFDEGRNFTSVRILDGSRNFPGRMTQPNVTFLGEKALIFYPKSLTPDGYSSWMQRTVPVQWFYEGDHGRVLGEATSKGG
ncbi:MAG: exo-alpha-sialidase [Acidobacteria bacterium]|nr:exo-alpha-sialidase [Acidobacteriota bacterium]